MRKLSLGIALVSLTAAAMGACGSSPDHTDGGPGDSGGTGGTGGSGGSGGVGGTAGTGGAGGTGGSGGTGGLPIDSGPPDADSGLNPLVGTWLYYPEATVHVLVFHADGTFEFDEIFGTGEGSSDDERLTGPYSISGETLTLSPTEVSCPTAAPLVYTPFSVSADALRLTSSAGMETFTRLTVGSVTEILPANPAYGCFSDGGGFMTDTFGPVSD